MHTVPAPQGQIVHHCPRCSLIVPTADQHCLDCQRELAGIPYYHQRLDYLLPIVPPVHLDTFRPRSPALVGGIGHD